MGAIGPDGNVVKGRGSLYCVRRGLIRKVETNLGISNGQALDLKRQRMLHVDTLDPVVYEYDITDCGILSTVYQYEKKFRFLL